MTTLIEYIDDVTQTLIANAKILMDDIAKAQEADNQIEQKNRLIDLARVRGRQAQLSIIRRMVLEGKIKELI